MKIKFTLTVAPQKGIVDLEDYDAEDIADVDFTNKESVINFITEIIEAEGVTEFSVGIDICEVDVDISEITVNDKPL